MRKAVSFAVAVCVVSALAGVARGGGPSGFHRLAVTEFAVLPAGVGFPEGIAANSDNGEIYVGTFNFGGNNKVLRYDAHGRLLAAADFDAPLLGLLYNDSDGMVYVCNAGNLAGLDSKIQRIPADFDASAVPEDVVVIPGGTPPPTRTVTNPDTSEDTITFGDFAAVPNALALSADGSLYVSDSFQGAIFRVPDVATCSAGGCALETVVRDGLLGTAGFPPFGANGIAFNADETALFVANTGDDRVLRIDLTDASPAVTVFAESVNGADGIAFDAWGRLWVAANQADEVAILDENGKVVDKVGDFQGIGNDGAPRGLLFPASIAFSKQGAFVTNLALALTGATGDEPEEEVTRFTVSRIIVPEGFGKFPHAAAP